MEVWVGTLAVLLVVLLVCHGARPACNFRIVVSDSRVEVSGPAVRGKQSVISEVFRRDLPDVRRARVEGHWDGRGLQLRIRGAARRFPPPTRGPLPPGLWQRIRNCPSATL